MKKILIIIAIIFAFTGETIAQSYEAQQLALDIEKLSQLKKILSNMKKGYQVLTKGYNTVKDITKGNFDLHQTFLDALMQVSPAVRKYKKIADIISSQTQLVKEYKSAFRRFKKCNQFNQSEIKYMGSVYDNLFKKSLQNLDELTIVITSGKLRMSDDERINAIDRIYADIGDKLGFLRNFNKENNILALQRGRESIDTKISQKFNGL